MSKITPGPWEVVFDEGWTIQAPLPEGDETSGRRMVADLFHRGFRGAVEADAHLISAAPELLAACEASAQCITDFLEIYKHGGQMVALNEAVKSLRDDALRLTKVALAKAEGGKS